MPRYLVPAIITCHSWLIVEADSTEHADHLVSANSSQTFEVDSSGDVIRIERDTDEPIVLEDKTDD